jgi:putative FmdB family regulatory protein
VPTYEYACRDCGTHVEVYQRFSEESLTVCGVCGGELRKVFHPAGILFKGSGFYSTDHRRSSALSKDGDKSDTGTSTTEKKEKTEKTESAASKATKTEPSGTKEKSA